MRVQLVGQVAALGQQQAVDVGGVGVHALREVLGDGHELDRKLWNVHREGAQRCQRGLPLGRVDLKSNRVGSIILFGSGFNPAKP